MRFRLTPLLAAALSLAVLSARSDTSATRSTPSSDAPQEHRDSNNRGANDKDANDPGNRPSAESGFEARFAEQVVVLTNRERAQAGLPPLKRQKDLTAAAHWMAQDMCGRASLDHVDSTARHMPERLTNFRYADYHVIGENIARGQQTPEEVVSAWMRSPGHRANILNPDFSEMGAGCCVSDSGRGGFWVEDFGSRFHNYPVVINNDEAQIETPRVHLTLYGNTWAHEMRLSDDGAHWTRWQTFQPTVDYCLPDGEGGHTVFVELRRGSQVFRTEAAVQIVPARVKTASTRSRPSAAGQ